MGKIQSVYLFLSGFVVPTLSELFSDYVALINGVGITEKRNLISFYSQISLGTKSIEILFHDMADNVAPQSSMNTLINQITGGIKITSHEAVDLIKELSEDFKILGISDYPSIWFDPLHKELSLVNLSFTKFFLTDQMKLGNLGRDLIDWLKDRNEPVLDSLLWIDANPKRSMYALSVGIHSVIYVDIHRLRRELVMRKMLPKK